MLLSARLRTREERFPYTRECIDACEEELGETSEKRHEAAVSLYVKYVSQEGAELAELYKDKLTDPVYLLRFLRVSKFDVEINMSLPGFWTRLHVDAHCAKELVIVEAHLGYLATHSMNFIWVES